LFYSLLKVIFSKKRCRILCRLHLAIACSLLLSPACRAQNIQYVRAQSTLVGTGTAGYTGDNGPASSATLSGAMAAVFDAGGNLFIADTNNNVVRRVDAATKNITTVAGTGTAGTGCTNGTSALLCAIRQPYGIAVDAAGNLYISDPNNNVIRVVNAAGNISVFAGTGTQGKSGNGGAALSATLYFPTDLQIDPTGTYLYFADSKNGEIRRVNLATNVLTLVAGTGIAGYTQDGILATASELNTCYGFTLDAAGNVYIADTKNYRIRRVDAVTGIITTVAGNGTAGTSPGSTLPAPNNGNGGAATSAMLVFPQRVLVDAAGNILIADSNDEQIRVVNAATGIIGQYAGVGINGSYVAAAPVTTAYTKTPLGIFSDSAGNIYYMETGYSVIRKLSTDVAFPSTAIGAGSAAQTIYASLSVTDTPLAMQIAGGFPDFQLGTVTGCTLAASNAAGTVCTASVSFVPSYPGLRTAPVVTTDASGSYIDGVSGIGKGALASVIPGTASTVAGGASAGSSGDSGAAAGALLNTPQGSAVDSAGNIFIADTANNKVRKIAAATGKITTIAGTGTAGSAGNGAAATASQLSAPHGVAVDATGNIYIVDTANQRIQMVSAQTGFISTVAGTGLPGYAGDGGAAAVAQLVSPSGIAVDAAANLYIADTGNHRIRKVNAQSGVITTFAGNGIAAFAGDGAAATAASLNAPAGVWADSSGTIYIADTLNHAIRAVNPATGFISTVAGTGGLGYTGDGAAATSAKLDAPAGVTTDATGDIYIADTGNNAIRLVAGGTITTIAGTGSAGFGGDGGASTLATLQLPAGIALDGLGRVYIADAGNHRLRLVDATNGAVAFSPQIVQTTSSQKNVSIVNTGNTALTLVNIALTGPFTQVGTSTCTASSSASPAVTTTLAPGAGCVLGLTFSPVLASAASGTVTITNSGAGPSKTISLSGTGLPAQTNGLQSITFAALSDVPYGTSPITLNASASSGLQVSYSVTGPATLSSSVLTLTGVGAVSITASQTGNASFAAATPVTRSFNVTPGLLTITPVNASIVYGAAIPAFSYTVSGLAATDTLATALTGIPALTTTATSASAPGAYPITASAGTALAANYTLAFAAGTLTISKVSSTTTLASSATSVSSNQTFTLTATVTHTGSGSPSGTVTFSSGAIILGTATVTNGTATFSVSNLAVGTYGVVATYSGDADFLSSSSSSLAIVSTLPPDFTLTGTPSQLAITLGQAGLETLTLTSVSSYSGQLQMSCSPLPANVLCTFSPALLMVNSSTQTVLSELVISTVGPSTGSVVPLPGGTHRGKSGILLLFGLFSLGLFVRRGGVVRRSGAVTAVSRGIFTLLITSAMLLGMAAMNGCGVGGPTAAAGSFNVTVSATNTATNLSHSVNVAVTLQ